MSMQNMCKTQDSNAYKVRIISSFFNAILDPTFLHSGHLLVPDSLLIGEVSLYLVSQWWRNWGGLLSPDFKI